MAWTTRQILAPHGLEAAHPMVDMSAVSIGMCCHASIPVGCLQHFSRGLRDSQARAVCAAAQHSSPKLSNPSLLPLCAQADTVRSAR